MAIDYLCFDGDVANNIAPHRPSIEDVGSDTYQDFPAAPVDERYEISARNVNQICGVVPQLSKMGDQFRATVRFSAGVPSVHSQAQCRTAPVTITVTDNGTGDTSLTWPANSFAPSIVDPRVTVNGDTPGYGTGEAITNGVRIRTFDTAGAAANLPFTVAVG